MNKVILMGRLTKDPEVKQTPSNISVCSFSIAVDRRFKTQDGKRETDFINCVAWRQLAELLGNYFHKGSRIAIVGSLQSRSYDDQNGQKRTVTEVVVEEVEFVDTKADAEKSAPQTQQTQATTPPPAPQAAYADTPEVEVTGNEGLPFDVMGIV